MTVQDQRNLAAAFCRHFRDVPSRSQIREWMRDVRWILNLSPGGMNKAYRIIDTEMQRLFGVRLL